MRCPVCDSLRVVFMNQDLCDVKGIKYSHECLKCGCFLTRKEVEESFKADKQVLMEEVSIEEKYRLSDKSQKLRGKYLI